MHTKCHMVISNARICVHHTCPLFIYVRSEDINEAGAIKLSFIEHSLNLEGYVGDNSKAVH